MLDYSTNEIPADYYCRECNSTNCKLFRNFSVPSYGLVCAPCASRREEKNISDMDDSGVFTDDDGLKNDRIGWYYAAIPLPDNSAYWEYAGAPDDAVKWWCALETKARPNIDTSSIGTPKNYWCIECAADDCKLWRKQNGTSTFCAECVAKDVGIDVNKIDDQGKIVNPLFARENVKTDWIGSYMPAVPNLEGTGYWKFTAAPEDRVIWWRNLQTQRIHPQELFFQ